MDQPSLASLLTPHDPARDVRDLGLLADRVSMPPRHGKLWPLVAPPYGGKTWALRAIERRLCAVDPRAAVYVQGAASGREETASSGVKALLIDDADLATERAIEALLARCEEAHRRGSYAIVALTPAGWSAVVAADPGGSRVSMRELLFLRPMRPLEGRRLARTDLAKRILSVLPWQWRRSPLLLTFILAVADATPTLADDVPALVSAALAGCREGSIDYARAVLAGLDEAQRATMREVAAGATASPDAVLIGAGLLDDDEEAGRHVVADPVVDAALAAA